MKPRSMTQQSLLAAACAGGLTCLSMADTFTMKDGTKLEGKILRQDATHYLIEVQVTKSIKDERTVARADVASVAAEKPDLKAFEEISKLWPTPDLLTADDYAARIKKVEGFLSEHRASEKAKATMAILADLKNEANQILAGAVKVEGKIISPTDYRANAYDVDARIKAASIRAQVKAGQTVQALRSFADFDRDFQNTEARKELVPFIVRTIQTYITRTSELANSYDARCKERQTGLDRMSGADRSATERAIQEESAASEAKFKAEESASVGWVTLHPFCKPTLDKTVAFGNQELSRINGTSSETYVDAGKIYRETLALILGAGEATAISSAISAAESAKMASKYLETLKTTAAAKGAKP